MSRAKALDGIRAEEYMMLKAVILANSAAPSGTNDEKHDKLKSDILGSFHDCVAATRYVTFLKNSCSPIRNEKWEKWASIHVFRSVKTAPVVVQSLLLLLPLIRQADLTIKSFLKNIHKSGGAFKLNKLLVEMLETQ